MIGDDIAAVLPRLRAEAESLMRDYATITRRTGYTIAPDNGARTPTWRTVAMCPARVARVESGDREAVTGGQKLTLAAVEYRLPWHITDLRVGDRITLTSASDARLLDVPVTITDISDATHAVARRVRGVLDEDRHIGAAQAGG